MRTLHTVLTAALLFAVGVQTGFAGPKELKKQAVYKAMNEMAYYSANVLLDEEGRSKCDYNVTEGKWYPYEPAWHTGQVINGLTDVYNATSNEDYLEAAKKAGNWWTSLLITEHPDLEGMLYAVHGDHAGNVIVFATISDGTPGLFNLWRTTGIDKYAAVPTSAGQWMLERMYVEEEGVFYDNVSPETGEVYKENSPFWPEKENQTLYDVARPNNEGSLYKDMYEYTGDEKYKEVFINICESLVEKQDEYGIWMDFMPNNREVGNFHPRFNLWNAESLVEGYELTGDQRYLDAAKRALDFYIGYQAGSGTFHYKNYVDGTTDKGSITGSATAFIGILGLRINQLSGTNEYDEAIERSLDWVLYNRFFSDHPDENLAGALINLRVRHKKGKLWITQRDVGTAFGMRFLAAYYQHHYANEK